MGNILSVFGRIKRPSLRQGVIFGLLLGGIEIVLWLLANFIKEGTIQSILGTLALAAFLILGYMAGQRAAQETGKMGTGVAAGLWTGLIGGFLEGIIPFIIDLIFLPTIVTNVQQDYKAHPANYASIKFSDITTSYVLTSIVIQLIYVIALYTLIALLGGALGGFLGRRRALVTQEADGEYVSADLADTVDESAEAEQISTSKRSAKSTVAEAEDVTE